MMFASAPTQLYSPLHFTARSRSRRDNEESSTNGEWNGDELTSTIMNSRNSSAGQEQQQKAVCDDDYGRRSRNHEFDESHQQPFVQLISDNNILRSPPPPSMDEIEAEFASSPEEITKNYDDNDGDYYQRDQIDRSSSTAAALFGHDVEECTDERKLPASALENKNVGGGNSTGGEEEEKKHEEDIVGRLTVAEVSHHGGALPVFDATSVSEEMGNGHDKEKYEKYASSVESTRNDAVTRTEDIHLESAKFFKKSDIAATIAAGDCQRKREELDKERNSRQRSEIDKITTGTAEMLLDKTNKECKDERKVSAFTTAEMMCLKDNHGQKYTEKGPISAEVSPANIFAILNEKAVTGEGGNDNNNDDEEACDQKEVSSASSTESDAEGAGTVESKQKFNKAFAFESKREHGDGGEAREEFQKKEEASHIGGGADAREYSQSTEAASNETSHFRDEATAVPSSQYAGAVADRNIHRVLSKSNESEELDDSAKESARNYVSQHAVVEDNSISKERVPSPEHVKPIIITSDRVQLPPGIRRQEVHTYHSTNPFEDDHPPLVAEHTGTGRSTNPFDDDVEQHSRVPAVEDEAWMNQPIGFGRLDEFTDVSNLEDLSVMMPPPIPPPPEDANRMGEVSSFAVAGDGDSVANGTSSRSSTSVPVEESLGGGLGCTNFQNIGNNDVSSPLFEHENQTTDLTSKRSNAEQQESGSLRSSLAANVRSVDSIPAEEEPDRKISSRQRQFQSERRANSLNSLADGTNSDDWGRSNGVSAASIPTKDRRQSFRRSGKGDSARARASSDGSVGGGCRRSRTGSDSCVGRKLSGHLRSLSSMTHGAHLSSVKEQMLNLHIRGDGSMMGKLFGESDRPNSSGISFGPWSRILLPWSVFYNALTEKWVAAINTNQKALDSNNTNAASKALKTYSFPTKHEAEEFALATTPPRMLPFANSPLCSICQCKFAVFRRACHCRNCGVCVCSKCAISWPAKMIPKTYNIKNEASVNLCKSCDWLCTAFRQSLLNGQQDQAVALHATGNVNLRTAFANVKGETFYPIHCAALGGNLKIVRWLIDSHCCPITKYANCLLETSKGRSLLSIAMEHQQVNLLRYLVVEKNVSLMEAKDMRMALLSLDAVLRKLPAETQAAAEIRERNDKVSQVRSTSSLESNGSKRSASVAAGTFFIGDEGFQKQSTMEGLEDVLPEDTGESSFAEDDDIAMLHLSHYESMGCERDSDDFGNPHVTPVTSNDDSENKDETFWTKDECIICYENTIDCVITPCGHQICCLRCSSNLSVCPVCDVSCSFMRVYKA